VRKRLSPAFDAAVSRRPEADQSGITAFDTLRGAGLVADTLIAVVGWTITLSELAHGISANHWRGPTSPAAARPGLNPAR
jgi:hypothetical protein